MNNSNDAAQIDEHMTTSQPVLSGSLRRQIIFWILFAATFFISLYAFSSILLHFVTGMVLAYFLDPVADRMEKLGLSRTMASLLILLAFLIAFILALIIVVPLLASQMIGLLAKIPDYVAALQQRLAGFDPTWVKSVLGVDSDNVRAGLRTLVSQGASFASSLFQSVWSSGATIIDIAGFFVITPVVAFYLLRDWDVMVARVDSWIPRDHLVTVRRLANEIDLTIAAFVRGQGTLCLILGTYYASCLIMTGLNFGLLIGFFAGLVSFIPYVGSMVGLGLAAAVAIVQFWPDWPWIALILSVFLFGQFVEGYILNPVLIGGRVGLHPVWLLFALFAFAGLFGFVGMLVAVPAASAIGVLVRFGLERYMASPVYRGGHV